MVNRYGRVWAMAAMSAIGVMVGACGRSSTPPAATQAAARVKSDLSAAEQEAREAATQAEQKAGPALREAGAEGRDLIHRGAQKVADLTASSQPATAPATQP